MPHNRPGLVFVILLYVIDELSYDTFQPQADKTYRVVNIYDEKGVGEQSSSSPFPLAAALRNEFRSNIALSGRIFNFQKNNHSLQIAGKRYEEKRFYFVDPEIVEIFAVSLPEGSPREALQKPNRILISEQKATELFGNRSPIGDTIFYEGDIPLVIEGIMADCPSQTHFRYDFLASFASLTPIMAEIKESSGWIWNPCWTYIVLRNPEDFNPVSQNLPRFVQNYFYDARKEIISLKLQPLKDIHLKSDLDYEIEKNGNYTNLIILIGIALFLLINALVNYINLTTAEGINRTGEIATKKALGASRWAIVCQFLFESIIITFFSLLLALALIELILPVYSAVTEKVFSSLLRINPWLTALVGGITLLTGLLAGAIPALILSGQPVAGHTQVSRIRSRRSGSGLRRLLVVWQFSVSLCLIFVTIGLFRQLRYVQTANLGFDYDNIVVLNTESSYIAKDYMQFRKDIAKIKGVKAITSSNYLLGVEHNLFQFYPEIPGDTSRRFYPAFLTTGNFFETFDIPYRWRSDSADLHHRLYINQAMIDHVKWGQPNNAEGKNIITPHGRYPVAGVLADFHVTSLHQAIVPFIVETWENNRMESFASHYVYIRTDPNEPAVISRIEAVWNQYEKSKKFTWKWHKQLLEELYHSEKLLSRLAIVFSGISIAIAILGMFGLTVYLTQHKRLEIGIRRSIGAGISEITNIFFRDYFLVIIISHIIAWPLAWLIIHYTGQTFSYHAPLPYEQLLYGAILATCTIIAAISLQIVRAALASPSVALRYS